MASMWTETGGLIGVGYEGLAVEELSDRLSRWGVTLLVDVRLNAISRKPGFSKSRLAAHLAEHGIAYLHRPALGNPKDNRAGYAYTGTNDGNAARATFRERLAAKPAADALHELAELAAHQHVAVFCFEQSELHCHRHEVLHEANLLLDVAQTC
ncbi:Protein of unknown function, DUF488 [Paramicrobacterium humi]|uniref:DUF488 domain-containing protein n=2 Tax=Paramicrobacterium humi TaxID=640635 RepID=A0A1H4K2R9_9MICO|nr:Protein of unknown function, DUF488 [Microbacterium humi]